MGVPVTWVRSLAWHSGLGTQCCCSCGLGHNWGSNLILGLEAPCAAGWPKMTKKKKRKWWFPKLETCSPMGLLKTTRASESTRHLTDSCPQVNNHKHLGSPKTQFPGRKARANPVVLDRHQKSPWTDDAGAESRNPMLEIKRWGAC